jgi:hypothetical protein
MERFFSYIPMVNPMLKISNFCTKSLIETDLTMLCRFNKEIFSLGSFLLAVKRKENKAGISPVLVLNGAEIKF